MSLHFCKILKKNEDGRPVKNLIPFIFDLECLGKFRGSLRNHELEPMGRSTTVEMSKIHKEKLFLSDLLKMLLASSKDQTFYLAKIIKKQSRFEVLS